MIPGCSLKFSGPSSGAVSVKSDDTHPRLMVWYHLHLCNGTTTSCWSSWSLKVLIILHKYSVTVYFDWSKAGRAKGAILSCHILPSDVISALKSADALIVTCFCLQCTWRVLFCHVAHGQYYLPRVNKSS